MPNWTANTIRAMGTPKDLRAFLDAVKWEDNIFDFNRIIPMPELLKHTGRGCRTIDGERVEAWYVMDRAEPFRAESVRRFTAEEEAVLAEIGYRDWYGWSVEHWGTKWNACNPKVDESGIADGSVEISFDTAWAEPLPVIQKMCRMFPQVSFVCTWEYEDDDERYALERVVANRGEG